MKLVLADAVYYGKHQVDHGRLTVLALQFRPATLSLLPSTHSTNAIQSTSSRSQGTGSHDVIWRRWIPTGY